ncbi:MAG: sulfatase-like hydrolase/transferase [Pyrinomonadaceae bacterium]|nr:sulfatase-like hydrolase/transferase [Pyrinomonadaceae bacterium]
MRDLIAALSLSNLCFIASWRAMLYPPFNGYLIHEQPDHVAFAALMLDVLLLAALMWTPIPFIRRWKDGRTTSFARWTFLAVTLIALNGVRIQFHALSVPGLIEVVNKKVLSLLLVMVFGASVFVLVRWSNRVINAACMVIAVLTPFVFVTFSQAMWVCLKDYATVAPAESRPLAVRKHAERPATRVVWIVFDELDYRTTFATRPAAIELPELDRLQREAIVATDAYPPAEQTLLSMPALITGKYVSAAQTVGPDELMITFAGTSQPIRWSMLPNIFSQIRASGGGTAVIGWYHPYCRVIGDDLTRCFSQATSTEVDWRNLSISGAMLVHTQSLISIVPLAQHVPYIYKKRHAQRYLRLHEQATEAVADTNLSLVMVHYSVPHHPYIYDRRADDFTFGPDGNYLDNLELVDRTLGEIRRAMELASVWDDTVVVVSADHAWRVYNWSRQSLWTKEEEAVTKSEADKRVPFMLKLKRQRESTTYDSAFNTVLSHDLLLSILHGEVFAPSDVTAWLDHHRSTGESAY